MGLGNRTARQHETVAAHTAGVDPSQYWEFQPGQAVMTVDGFSGSVASVNDGPLSGTESYNVILDGGLGGGEYTASQLTAKAEASQYTAAQDYPELAEILVERPDIAPNTRWASLQSTAGDEHWDWGVEMCPECHGPVDTNRGQSMSDHLEHEHGLDANDYHQPDGVQGHWERREASFRDGPSEHDTSRPQGEHGIETFDGLAPNDGAEPGVDEHGHLTWDGKSPACRDTNDYSMFGQNDAVKQGAYYTVDELRAIGEAEERRLGMSAEDILRAQASEDFYQRQMQEMKSPDYCVGCNSGSPEHAQTGESHQQWAERKHSEGTHDAWGRPLMQPYDGHDAWSCNNYGCTEHPQSMYPQDGQVQGTPGWLEHDTHPDAEVRRQVNQAMPRSDTEDANWLLHQQPTGPSRFSSLQAEAAWSYAQHSSPIVHPGGHPAPRPLMAGDTVMHPETGHSDRVIAHTPTLLRFERGGIQHRAPVEGDFSGVIWSSDSVDEAGKDVPAASEQQKAFLDSNPHGPTKYSSFDPWGIVTEAAADADFRFEVTAAWSDVRAKAKRIRSEGGVHVTLATEGMIHAEVKGDHHVYETGIQRMPGRTAVQGWSCGCKWGAYHWGAEDDFSRFAGRMCSHALALQYEAQSRGMFGRDVRADDRTPSWVPRMVVVKHDIDSGKDLRAPSTPVLASLIRHARRNGEPLADVVLALGLTGLATEAAVNDAWGEPTPSAPQYGPGPTKPRDVTENPASAGWATAPEPQDWGQAGPSGLTHMVSSLSDDEALFEPELGKEAFLPLLIPLAEGLAGGAAAAGGAAEVAGAGAAAAGAGEAAAGAGARSIIPKVLDKAAPRVLTHEVLKGADAPKAPSGPPAPQAGPAHGPDDDDTNPLNFGARADLHEEPEGALPSTDGDLEPEDESFVSTGSIDDIVAQFQATAGARALGGSGGGSAAPTGSSGSRDGLDIAAAAKMFLETGQKPSPDGIQATALKDFTLAEQQKIINEGENVRAANFDRLDIKGTHYEPLEAALAAAENDEEWLS